MRADYLLIARVQHSVTVSARNLARFIYKLMLLLLLLLFNTTRTLPRLSRGVSGTGKLHEKENERPVFLNRSTKTHARARRLPRTTPVPSHRVWRALSVHV